MGKVRVALAALVLCVPGFTLATPITVDFTVTTTQSLSDGIINPGYQSGVVGTGYVTFDFDRIPVGGLAPIDLSMSWLGATWDETTAHIGSLVLRGTQLMNFEIGGVGPQPVCSVSCVYNAASAPTDFFVTGNPNDPFSSYIHLQGLAGGIHGSTVWSVRPAVAVPEPATLVLMLAGLSLIGVWSVRRRFGQAS